MKKKAEKKTVKKSAVKSKPTKKLAVKKAVKKVKKDLTEKEKAQKEANRLISSTKKKSGKRPVKVSTEKQTESLLNSVIEGMREKKAKNITVVNLSNLENRVCDYFVIADAESKTHVEAIADSVEEFAKKMSGEKPYHVEGHGIAEWIIIDFVNIVAHVFQAPIREFYNLEGLWADAEFSKVES